MKCHEKTVMKYNGYKRYTDRDFNGKKWTYVIANWKCPLCKFVCECGMPRDRKTLKIHCSGTKN